MSDLEDYGETNQTLRKLLSISNLSNFTLNVLLNKNENVSEEQAQAIKALRKKMNIELTDHPSYWDRPDVIQEYGNHALTFKMIAERREGPTQSSKPKQQPLSLSLYQIEGNPFLERYNTTVTDLLNKEKVKSNQIARNKRKRAVEIADKEEDSVEEEI
jgi:bacterioferritin (cytochrome b1)